MQCQTQNCFKFGSETQPLNPQTSTASDPRLPARPQPDDGEAPRSGPRHPWRPPWLPGSSRFSLFLSYLFIVPIFTQI